ASESRTAEARLLPSVPGVHCGLVALHEGPLDLPVGKLYAEILARARGRGRGAVRGRRGRIALHELDRAHESVGELDLVEGRVLAGAPEADVTLVGAIELDRHGELLRPVLILVDDRVVELIDRGIDGHLDLEEPVLPTVRYRARPRVEQN